MIENHAAYDLHLHSYWSYDACAPVEYYFRKASELKLRAIAISEHFTMDSLPDIIATSRKYPDVRFIPAVEMTVRCSIGSLDMLCLGMPLEIPTEIEEIFEEYRQWQRDCGKAISIGMQSLGFDYTEKDRLELLKKYRPAKTIEKHGITHVQNGIQRTHFINSGYIKSPEEYGKLFEKFPRTPYPDAERILPVLKHHGALVMIAHPTSYFNKNDIKRMDALREELGFEGIECAHDLIPQELTPFYRDYCVRHKLFSSGGSDSHADHSDNPCRIATQHEFARHIGEGKWLDEIFERLKK